MAAAWDLGVDPDPGGRPGGGWKESQADLRSCGSCTNSTSKQ
jgi:hypothetical protein